MSPFMSFTGKTVAVTGARGGLGQALCQALRESGALVTPISRDDVWNPADYACVFFNAGFGFLQSSRDPLFPMAPELFAVNLLTPITLAQQALAAGTLHVHMVGSILSLVSSPLMSLYAATKYGLRGWAYGSARELPGRVSISYPNGIKTAYFRNLQGDPAILAGYHAQVTSAEANYDTPDMVAAGILEGIRYGGREIVPTMSAYDWCVKNEEPIRRMWVPGLQQPSVERFDWWEQVHAHWQSHKSEGD